MKISKQNYFNLKNIILFFFFLNGLFITKNRCSRIFGLLSYHTIVIFCVTLSTTCILTNHLPVIYYVISLSLTLAIVLWWILYLRRKQIYKIIFILLKKVHLNACQRLFLISSLIPFYIPFLLYSYSVYNIIIHGYKSRIHSQMSNNFLNYMVFFGEKMLHYLEYSIFHMTYVLFSVCCFLTLEYLKHLDCHKTSKYTHSTFRKMKFIISLIKQIENVLSLPILLLFCKESLDIFCVITAFCGGSEFTTSKIRYFTVSVCEIFWFLQIVLLAHSVQDYCLTILSETFTALNESEPSHSRFTYLNYKRWKSSITLTVGNMFTIKRSIILSAVTSAITYGVIISQFNLN